jgi:hypothetical protein
MGMISPQQQGLVNQFKGKTTQEQAETLAKICNEKGIGKSDLQKIMNCFK